MEFLYAMKAFVGTFFPNAFLDIELIPLKQINPYDAIHKPSFAEWMDTTTEYAPEHLLQDYARHISVTRDIVQGILSGRQILPILVTSDPNDQTMFIRRDGYCRYMAYKELGFPFIPAHIVTEDVALTQPQHGRGPFLV